MHNPTPQTQAPIRLSYRLSITGRVQPATLAASLSRGGEGIDESTIKRLLPRLHPLDVAVARELLGSAIFGQLSDVQLARLLPLLAQRDPAVLAVVIRLKQDHRDMAVQWAQVRAALSGLVEAGEDWAGFSAEDLQRFDAYDALYRRHLVDENGVVYPAARRLIRGETLQAMSADMMARRGVAI